MSQVDTEEFNLIAESIKKSKQLSQHSLQKIKSMEAVYLCGKLRRHLSPAELIEFNNSEETKVAHQKQRNLQVSKIKGGMENIFSSWRGSDRVPTGLRDQMFALLLELSNTLTLNEAKVCWNFFKEEMHDSTLSHIFNMDPWHFYLTADDQLNRDCLTDFKVSLADTIVWTSSKNKSVGIQTTHCELCHRPKKTNRYCYLHADKNKRRNREKIMGRHTMKIAAKKKMEMSEHNKWAKENGYDMLRKNHKSILRQRLEVWVAAKLKRRELSPLGRFDYKKEKDEVLAVYKYCSQFLPDAAEMIKPIENKKLNEFIRSLAKLLDVPTDAFKVTQEDPADIIINELARYQLAVDIFGHEIKEKVARKKVTMPNHEVKKAFQESTNKTLLAKKLGISRARLYQIAIKQ